MVSTFHIVAFSFLNCCEIGHWNIQNCSWAWHFCVCRRARHSLYILFSFRWWSKGFVSYSCLSSSIVRTICVNLCQKITTVVKKEVKNELQDPDEVVLSKIPKVPAPWSSTQPFVARFFFSSELLSYFCLLGSVCSWRIHPYPRFFNPSLPRKRVHTHTHTGNTYAQEKLTLNENVSEWVSVRVSMCESERERERGGERGCVCVCVWACGCVGVFRYFFTSVSIR